MGEHRMNNSAIFSIQHSSKNAALCMENKALLVTCITNFELLKVAKTNKLSTRNAVKALPHSCNIKKIALGFGSQAQYSTWLHLMLY